MKCILITAVVFCLLLSGCGGDSSSAPDNTAPDITKKTTVSAEPGKTDDLSQSGKSSGTSRTTKTTQSTGSGKSTSSGKTTGMTTEAPKDDPSEAETTCNVVTPEPNIMPDDGKDWSPLKPF